MADTKQFVTGMREEGRISKNKKTKKADANKFVTEGHVSNWGGGEGGGNKKFANMGCDRRPRAPVCDYTGSDLALFMGL